MPGIQYLVRGDKDIGLRLDAFPQHLHDRLFAKITSIMARLKAAVLADEPVKSGRLRAETESSVKDTRRGIIGRVFIDAKDKNEAEKANALEHGAHGAFTVKAHSAALDHFWSKLVWPRAVTVKSHSRRANIAARRFMRDPLDEQRGAIDAELRATVVEAEAESGLGE